MNGANTLAALIRRTKTGADAYGKAIFTEVFTVLPGIYWPASSTEAAVGQDQIVWHETVCLPTGTDVSAIDAVIPQVTLDSDGQPLLDGNGHPQGRRVEVDGQPTDWPANPFDGDQGPFSVVLQLTGAAG